MPWICMRESIKLAITNRRGFTRHVHRLLALLWRQLFQRRRRLRELFSQVDVAALNQRTAVIKQLPRSHTHARSRQIEARRPAHVELLRIVELGAFFIRPRELVELLD